jgi:CheY-like chemotaxis protein
MVEMLTTREKPPFSLRLLLVEDDPASLELMAEVLASLETEVIQASGSRKASDLLNRTRFDGIFLDLQMPDLHGFELTQMVRKSSWNKSTPVVVVTGRDDRDTMQRAFATGATFFLQKPVDRQKLTALFRTIRGSLLENRRRYTRVPLHTDVVCDVGARTIHGKSWNLSRGGMQVEVESLQLRDTVELSFRFPGSTLTTHTFGVVAWVKEHRQGIQFTKMKARDESVIREFIIRNENPDSD